MVAEEEEGVKKKEEGEIFIWKKAYIHSRKA